MANTVVLIDGQRKSFAIDLINRAPWGFVVTIKEPTRNTSQNAKMWACLTEISQARPEGYAPGSPEQWKSRFMNALGHEVQTDIGIDGQAYIIGLRSSQLTKSEFAQLIELIISFAAQENIVLHDPPVADYGA